MKTALRKTIATTIATLLVVSASAQTTIVSWDFEKGTTAAASGTGSIAGIGGASTSVDASKGITAGTATSAGVLESTITPAGYCFSTTNFPTQSTSNKTAGIQITASTAGYKNITLTMDMRHGNKCANTAVVQYTTDGSTWNDATTYTASITDDTWFLRTFDFSGISEVNNNANFAVRVVSSFASGTSAYATSNPTSTAYDVTKGYRFDNVTLKGTEISSGIEEATAGNDCKLSGNVLTFGSTTKSSIEIYSVSGLKVASFAPDSEVALNLPQGVYIVKTGSFTKKIFVK